MGEGALGKPDGVDGGEDRRGGAGEGSGEVAPEPIDGKEGCGRDHADEGAGAADDEAREVPPAGEQDGGEGRVGVGEGGDGDQGAVAEEVQGRGDVVAALIPEVGEAQEGPVAEEDSDKEEGVEGPERDVASSAPRASPSGLEGRWQERY